MIWAMPAPSPHPGLLIGGAEGVAGFASLVSEGPHVELFVWAKLVVDLGHDGAAPLNPAPPVPGINRGVADALEIDPSVSRRIFVRGERSLGGKVTLRRGPTPLAEIPFGPGKDVVSAELASTLQTSDAGLRGDEWIVVEGVEGPQARRWCKVPKLGVFAKWNDVEKLLLTSRICFVDVASWTISLVMRGSRKLLPAMVPERIDLSLLPLDGPAGHVSAVRAAIGRDIPRVEAEEKAPPSIDDEPTTGLPRPEEAEPHTVPGRAQRANESATRILTPEERAHVLAAAEKTMTSFTPPARRASSSGFRLGPLPRDVPKEKEEAVIDEESSLSRAFAAFVDEPPDGTKEPKKQGG